MASALLAGCSLPSWSGTSTTEAITTTAVPPTAETAPSGPDGPTPTETVTTTKPPTTTLAPYGCPLTPHEGTFPRCVDSDSDGVFERVCRDNIQCYCDTPNTTGNCRPYVLHRNGTVYGDG